MIQKHIHSPFIVAEDFLSPAQCETILSAYSLSTPSVDTEGNPLRYDRLIKGDDTASMLQSKVQHLVADIEERYFARVVGMENMVLNQYFEDPTRAAEGHGCASSKYVRKKWVKVKDIDLVGFVWLKDFNAGAPLDPRIEVYGGKLEFGAFNFSLVPQRGTLVLFPAGPHFITAISPILLGSLEQLRFGIKLLSSESGPWLYEPKNYPGSFTDWLAAE